ncbi:MAG TPA: guanylate kinase [Chitinophagaceae bacterium]
MSSSHKLIIITAPSGAGKTSITKHLLKTFPAQLAFSISAATRQKRNYEEDGVDYHFMSVDEFKEKIQNQSFVEWEMVYEGKYYGTLKSEIHRIWKQDKIPLLDIDVQGAVHVRQQHPEQALSIFIEPPSVEELKRRLNSRGTETSESLATRVNKATYELSFKDHFDKVIVNNDLDKACKEAETIVRAFIEE